MEGVFLHWSFSLISADYYLPGRLRGHRLAWRAWHPSPLVDPYGGGFFLANGMALQLPTLCTCVPTVVFESTPSPPWRFL